MNDDEIPDPERVSRHEMTPRQQDQLAMLLRMLEIDEHAPTAIRDGERAAQVHLADSLTALEIGEVTDAARIADIGSGAGFPGLAFAVALPEAHVSLIESQGRKCEFLGRACAAARVGNASVVQARVEEWSEGIADNDVVLARALAPQSVVLEYAAPLLSPGGLLVDWRGRRNPDGESAARHAAGLLGLRLREIRHTEPYEGALHHHLHVYEKVAETPGRFPRRAGVARKRPLGS
jgi:16S rRNA (guanine527-N7)-methyltransferase